MAVFDLTLWNRLRPTSNWWGSHSLSYLLCTLKGTCQDSWYKNQSNALCIVYAILFVDIVNMKIKTCNALNGMFITTSDTGVCGFYTTLSTGVKTLLYSVYSGLLPLQEGRLFEIWIAFCLVDLAVHQSVWGGSLVNFLGLVNYKGGCRQDTQLTPNS